MPSLFIDPNHPEQVRSRIGGPCAGGVKVEHGGAGGGAEWMGVSVAGEA